MAVRIVSRPIFYSERRRRHFITMRGAAMAEANARMYAWFPSESAEYEDEYGRCTYAGYHFINEPRLVAIRDKLVNRYIRQMKQKRDEQEKQA